MNIIIGSTLVDGLLGTDTGELCPTEKSNYSFKHMMHFYRSCSKVCCITELICKCTCSESFLQFAPNESEPDQTIINLLTVSCSITRPNTPLFFTV